MIQKNYKHLYIDIESYIFQFNKKYYNDIKIIFI